MVTKQLFINKTISIPSSGLWDLLKYGKCVQKPGIIMKVTIQWVPMQSGLGQSLFWLVLLYLCISKGVICYSI